MRTLNEQELEHITKLINEHQRILGGAMIMQMTHFQAEEMVAHTELENPKVVEGKFLITSIVRPLTEELRESIKNKDHGTITQQNS